MQTKYFPFAAAEPLSRQKKYPSLAHSYILKENVASHFPPLKRLALEDAARTRT